MELTEKQQHEQYYDEIYAALKNEPYANHLGMELVELGEGSAKVTLKPASHMLNTHGTVHGGVIFSWLITHLQPLVIPTGKLLLVSAIRLTIWERASLIIPWSLSPKR